MKTKEKEVKKEISPDAKKEVMIKGQTLMIWHGKPYLIDRYNIWARKQLKKKYGSKELEALFIAEDNVEIMAEVLYLVADDNLRTDYESLDVFLKSIASINEQLQIIKTAWAIIQSSITTDLSEADIAELEAAKKKQTIKEMIINLLLTAVINLIKSLGGRITT